MTGPIVDRMDFVHAPFMAVDEALITSGLLTFLPSSPSVGIFANHWNHPFESE